MGDPIPSRFLALPLELRLQIYAHVLSDFSLVIRRPSHTLPSNQHSLAPTQLSAAPTPIPSPPNTTITPPHPSVHVHPSSTTAHLSLLLTSRQIHTEALPLLYSIPKPLTFSLPYIDNLTPLPTLPPLFLPSIRTVLFPTRSGSRLLLEDLPNLRAIGVCRNALTRSPDLVWEDRWRGNGHGNGNHADGGLLGGEGKEETLREKLGRMREWLVWFVGQASFVGSLNQQWLLHYWFRGYYFPEAKGRRADVWCRVVGTAGRGVLSGVAWDGGQENEEGSERGNGGWKEDWVVRQAVWVNLSDLKSPERWRWCVPTRHVVGAYWSAASYNPPLEADAGDEGLAMICRWWGVPAKDGGEDVRLGYGGGRAQGVPFVWNGRRVYA